MPVTDLTPPEWWVTEETCGGDCWTVWHDSGDSAQGGVMIVQNPNNEHHIHTFFQAYKYCPSVRKYTVSFKIRQTEETSRSIYIIVYVGSDQVFDIPTVQVRPGELNTEWRTYTGTWNNADDTTFGYLRFRVSLVPVTDNPSFLGVNQVWTDDIVVPPVLE
jgi:hypothetical protein